MEDGRISYVSELDDKGFAEGAKNIQRRMRDLTANIEKSGSSIDEVFDKIGTRMKQAFAVSSIVAFEKKIIEVRSEMESLQKSFESLAGERIGKQLYEDIKQFATSTPMMMKDLAKGAQTLLGFNIEAQKVMPILKQIGDISMGDAQKFNSLTLAFAQMSSTGKLMGQDLLQMINAGFNPLVVISEKTGKSVAKLKEEMSEGKITVEMVEEAFRAATAEGGKFHNMLETQSKTMKGALSNLHGAYEDMLNEIGEKQQGLMLKGVELAQTLVQNYEKVGQVLLGLITTYGTYRAAVMAVSVAEGIASGQIVLKTRALRACAAAQALLNKTMLANPYVLAATALGVLVGSIIAARDGLTDAERAQRDYNATLEEAKRQQEEYNSETEKAIGLAQDESAATENREGAMQTLISRYPEIIKKYIDEKGHLTDILNLKREIAAYDGKVANLDNKTRAEMYTRYIQVLQKAKRGEKLNETESMLYQGAQKKYNDATPWYNKFSGDYTNKAVDYFRNLAKEANRAYGRGNTVEKVTKFMESMGEMKTKELEALTKSLRDSEKKLDGKLAVKVKELDDYLERSDLDSIITKAEGIIEARNGKKKEQTDKEKAAAAKAAEKAAKAAEKAAKESAAEREKLFELELAGMERQAKQKAALESALADKAIAEERSASKRELMQMEKDHKERLAAIDRQAEEYKKEAYEAAQKKWEALNKGKAWADTDDAKAGWQAMSLTAGQEKELQALRDAINADAVRKQKEYLDQLIQSHASYASKKLAIEKKYSEDVAAINAGIAEAEANGYAQRVEELKQSLAEAEKERAKSQAQLSLEQLKETPEYIRAFEDLDNTSNETLEHLIKMFEDAKQAAAQSLNPKDLKEYTDAIEQMQGKIRERDPFKALAQSSKELSEAHKKVKKAEQDLDTIRKTGVLFITEVDKKTGELTARLLSQEEAEKRLREAKDNEFKAQSRYSKAQQASLNIINELGSSISNLGNAIGGTAGKIVELIGDVISFASGAITALGETTKGVSTAVKAAEKASAILAIISAALQIVNKITDVLGADYEHYNKLVDQYENLIDVWDTLIAKKREYINESYGAEATKVGQEVLDILNKQILAYRQLGKERLSSGASMGSNTIGVRIRKDLTLDDWRAVQRSLGSTDEFAGLGGRLEGLFDLSAKQLEKLREDAPAFWAKLDEDVRKYLQGIIDGSEEVEKQQEAMIEKLTGMTSGGMFEDFRNSLYELADGSKEVFEDIAENWQKMVNRMVVDNLIAKEFQDDLEKILKDIADIQTKRNETNTVEYMAKYEEEKNNLLKELEEVKSRFFIADVENDIYTSNPIYQRTREEYEKDIARIKAIQEEIKKLDEEYEQALVTIDDEEYKRQLNEKLEEYKKIYGEAEGKLKLYQELGIIKSIDEATAEAKTYFEDLRNSWKSSLMDMTQTSEDWKNTLIDQIFSDLVESAILEKPFDMMIAGAEKHFTNFQEYLDDWTKRYKEIIEDQNLTDEQRNAKLKNLLDEQTDIRDKQADEAKKIGEGIGKDMSESFSNSLDNLGDTLLDALLDTEKDAQQMGVEIAQTLIKEMLTEMLASEKYASRIEAIRKMWQAILKGEDKEHTFADVLQEISDLNDAIANDEDISQLAETYQILGKQAEEAKTSLGDLRDVFMDAVTDMDNGMDNLKKKLKETAIKDLIQKMLFTKDFDEWEKSWNERYLKALEAGDEALINNLNKELEERVDAAAKSVSNYTKQLQEAAVDTTFTDMEDSFVSALMDMDGDIQGFAEDMKKTIVQKLVESFMVSEKIKPMLDELQKTFDFAMGQKGWTNEQRIDFMSKGGTIDGKEYKGIDEYSDDINDWKNTVDGLLAYAGIVKNETDELLGSITSNITSMLTDGESTAKDFAASMKESIVNSLIEAYTASEDFQEGLADVKKQMQEAIESGDPVKIQKAEEAAKDFWGNAVDGVKEYTDALEKAQQEQDTTFTDMASSWVSNLMDFSATAEDWAEDIGRTMAQRIIEQMVEPTMIAPLLNNLQEVFNKVMAENTTEDEDGKAVYNWEGVLGNQELAQAIADMEAKYPELKELIQNIMGAFGVKPDDTIANSLDSLGSTLIDRLTDMETSAEDYGKKIGAALVKDMLDQLVATEAYADEIKAIQELWQDILSGADTEHTWENVLERVNALTEKLTNENKGLIETYGELTKKVEEEAKAEEAFSGLGDKIVSSLMDANTTAESFAKEIAKTMVEQMLGQIVESQFATKMQAIQDEWAAALAANDVNAIARIKEEIVALEQEVGVATKEMVDSVKEVIANDTTFSGMTSSWVSALSDMSKTAEDWGQDVGKTMAEAIISQIIAPTLIQPLLDEMQKAFDAVMAVEGATWQMAAAAMVPYIEQVKATYEELQPIVEEIYGSFGVYREVADTVEEAVDKVEYALDDMRGTFDSTLMDMESTAEKRMRNISEILAEKYIDKFILGDLFDQQMEAWQQQFENIVSGGLSEEERERQLVQLRNAITAAEEGYMEESRAIQELLGLNASDDQKATMNMADKITYDQADQLLGINMAQEMTLEQGLYVQRQILSTIQQMGGITSVSGDGRDSDIFNRLGYTNDYLRAIRDSNDAILTSLNAKLDLIYGQLSNII